MGGGRSNTPNHISGIRSYHTQQSCPPPLPPYPAGHGGVGGGRSYDAQSHSSSGSGSAVAPLTPTGMAGGHHVQVCLTATILNVKHINVCKKRRRKKQSDGAVKYQTSVLE